MNDRRPYEYVIAPNEALPYSKGVMARMLMVTGIPPSRAYELARQIERQLVERGTALVTDDVLFGLAADVLSRESDHAVARLRRFRALHDLDFPVIVLIGGSTGAGKSAVATEVAHRLGITRVTSTDFLRQSMRAFFPREFMPSIHHSSFDAARPADGVPREAEIVRGFREQARNVLVSVDAVLQRAVTEQLSMVLEGVHLVPGMIPPVGGRAIVTSCVLVVDDELEHGSRFMKREGMADSRRAQKYLQSMGNIRTVERYLRREADEHPTPVIVNRNLEVTIHEVLDLTLLAAERACAVQLA